MLKLGKADALSKEARAQLERDGVVVVRGLEPQFFHLYDDNAYHGIPSLLTADTLLHLFHLRFDALLQQIERLAGERFRQVGLDRVADDEPATVDELADGELWSYTATGGAVTLDGYRQVLARRRRVRRAAGLTGRFNRPSRRRWTGSRRR